MKGQISNILNAKQIEGCSSRTIQYYRMTAEHLLRCVKIPIQQMSTEDIRKYLIDYTTELPSMIFPLYCSEEAMKNPNFKNGYGLAQRMLETFSNMV